MLKKRATFCGPLYPACAPAWFPGFTQDRAAFETPRIVLGHLLTDSCSTGEHTGATLRLVNTSVVSSGSWECSGLQISKSGKS